MFKINETLKFQFPEFKDPENTQVTLKILFGLKSFIYFDDQKKTLTMKPNSTGVHPLKVRLTDEAGEYSDY